MLTTATHGLSLVHAAQSAFDLDNPLSDDDMGKLWRQIEAGLKDIATARLRGPDDIMAALGAVEYVLNEDVRNGLPMSPESRFGLLIVANIKSAIELWSGSVQTAGRA